MQRFDLQPSNVRVPVHLDAGSTLTNSGPGTVSYADSDTDAAAGTLTAGSSVALTGTWYLWASERAMLRAVDSTTLPLDERVETLESDGAAVKGFTKPTTLAAYGGMLADDVTNNGALMSAAIDTLTVRGGSLSIPRVPAATNYIFNTTVDLESEKNVILSGEGGALDSPGYGSTLIYAASGTSPFINAKKAQGLVFRDLQFVYNNTGFTGHLLDLRNDSGSGANDTRQITFENCYFGGNGTAKNAASLVCLDGAINTVFRDCVFMYSQRAVIGRLTAGGYANVVRFERCLFWNTDLYPILNPGESWVFDNCTFEGRTGDLAGCCEHDAGVLAKGLTFRDCWWGDVLAGTGNAQIKFAGTGLVLDGGRMGVEFAGNKFVVIDANNCEGIAVSGITFVGDGGSAMPAVDFGATTGHVGVKILGNAYEAGITAFAGTIPNGALMNELGQLISLDVLNTIDAHTYIQSYSGTTAACLVGNNGGQPGIFMGLAQDVVLTRGPTTVPTLKSQSPLTLPTFTVATRPAAANVAAGTVIFVSDGGAGAVFQGSTGAAWVNLG